MAKNITILEGRETRTFGGVEKLKTNLAGGGTCNWIPEDEASEYVEADELEVTENGYYTPEPGEFYSGVDVNVEVEPELEEITITENGVYLPEGDGFSRVSVEVDSSGGGGDPEVHGNEVQAIAQTDINAGDTVAIQSDNREPISVSCPLPGIGTNANPASYDGKDIYWQVGDANSCMLRKKPINNIESSSYTDFIQHQGYGIPSFLGGVFYQKGLDENNQTILASLYTSKTVSGSGFFAGGKFVEIGGKLYDRSMHCVNDHTPSHPWASSCYAISSSRYIMHPGYNSASFNVGLIGGSSDTYLVTLPEDYQVDPQTGDGPYFGTPMICGTNHVCFLVTAATDRTLHCLLSCEFDASAEYEGNTHNITGDIVFEWNSSTDISINGDPLYDRWGVATDNGFIVLNSDLSYEYFELLKSTATPTLIAQYVFLNGSCYKLMGNDTKMIATTSKGADGQLGVAKHNVKAGETGTAIILFS
jgi:hypothetical protein